VKVVYIAHQLSAPTREGIDKNRANAARWVAWLAREFRIAPVADWIVLSGEWSETAENRALGLEIDKQLVRRCDEMWLVGGLVSTGMLEEMAVAQRAELAIHDLTALGYHAPEGPNPLTRRLIAEVVGMR
jgi:hypothetical protein